MATRAIEVIYENGVFRPVQPVSLPEGSRGKVYASGEPPVIVKTADICGGRARIDGTRITVWGLVAWRQRGLDDTAILEAVAGLTPEQLAAALRYADEHADEITRDLEENEE